MADMDFREVIPEKELNKGNEKKNKRCSRCNRSEQEAGKLIEVVPGTCICRSCQKKLFDPMAEDEDNRPDEIIEDGYDNDDMNNIEGFPFNLGSIFGGGDNGKNGNIHMINLNDLMGGMGFPGQPKVKAKEKKAKPKKDQMAPVIDIKSIPAPHKIKAKLDEYIVGQEKAKKVMSVAVYNHYKRVMAPENPEDDIEIEKSNMLMIGPTGSGKTYLVKTLARLLDVPLAITDATSLTEAGYIGDDIESVVSKLLAAADNDVEKAEHGIIFIDEIDKLAKKRNANQRDVSGESVQQGMLKLLEGAEVEVPVGASSKNAMVPMATVDTSNILFICGGAFPDLEEIIKERLNKEASIGFKADLKDKYDNEENLLLQATVDDVRKFGMIPEFLGRLPILFSLEALTEDMLVRILTEPKNAIVKQYRRLLEMDEVNLEFEQEALYAIAKKAKAKHVGARALRAILEEYMLDIMYEIPKDDNIGEVVITGDYIEHKGGPRIGMRGMNSQIGMRGLPGRSQE